MKNDFVLFQKIIYFNCSNSWIEWTHLNCKRHESCSCFLFLTKKSEFPTFLIEIWFIVFVRIYRQTEFWLFFNFFFLFFIEYKIHIFYKLLKSDTIVVWSIMIVRCADSSCFFCDDVFHDVSIVFFFNNFSNLSMKIDLFSYFQMSFFDSVFFVFFTSSIHSIFTMFFVFAFFTARIFMFESYFVVWIFISCFVLLTSITYTSVFISFDMLRTFRLKYISFRWNRLFFCISMNFDSVYEFISWCFRLWLLFVSLMKFNIFAIMKSSRSHFYSFQILNHHFCLLYSSSRCAFSLHFVSFFKLLVFSIQFWIAVFCIKETTSQIIIFWIKSACFFNKNWKFFIFSCTTPCTSQCRSSIECAWYRFVAYSTMIHLCLCCMK